MLKVYKIKFVRQRARKKINVYPLPQCCGNIRMNSFTNLEIIYFPNLFCSIWLSFNCALLGASRWWPKTTKATTPMSAYNPSQGGPAVKTQVVKRIMLQLLGFI